MDFPKKQAQRLMPLYLLEYSEKLFENHPDPEAPWGGGGDYTAGDGIDITNNVISVDEDVAMKTDLSDYAKLNDDTQNITANTVTVTPGGGYIHTTYGPTTIAMSIPRTPGYTITIPTKDGTMALTSDIPSLTGYATEQWVQNQGYSTFSGSYNDLTNKPDFSNYYYLNNTIEYGGHRTSINERGLEYSKEYNDNKISLVSDYLGSEQWLSGKAVIVIENTNSKTAISDSIGVFDSSYNQGVIVGNDKVEVTNRMDNTSTSLKSGKLTYIQYGNFNFDFNLPTSKNPGSYTLATTDDIPSLSGYATEYWVNNQGYLTSITSSDVVAALGYVPGTSNFSGSYNDLTDTPTIGHGVLTIQVNGVNVKQFSANETAAKTANIIVPTKTSDLTNDSDFITNSAIANDIEYIDLGSGSYTPVITQTIVDKIATNPKKYVLLYKYTKGSYTYGLNLRLVNETSSYYGYECYCVKRYNSVEGFNQCSEGFALNIGKSPITSTLDQWTVGGSSYSAGTGININNNTISIDNTVALKSEIPTATSDLTNDSGFITGITSSDVTTALGYTPGTSNFSGNYNDLTNKPTIPDAVSGTNDGTNWTSLTVGNDTYAIPQGGGGGHTYSLSKTFETLIFTLSDNTTTSLMVVTDVTLDEL